ncbi:MAG: alkaline phosphatase family protein [Myxococcaceae bacterium]|nr:alkaline phosphatase family protein [Myxococcaceae bacterium]
MGKIQLAFNVMKALRAGALPCVLLGLAAACGEPPPQYGENRPTDYNVVLVTFDGARWQEFFAGTDELLAGEQQPLFPLFWSKIAPRGVVYGDPRTGSAMTVSTAANASLPGYTSIYAEVDQGCLTNGCGRIAVPTFVDRLKDELALPKEQLAVFAAWAKLRLAVTGRDDVAVVHAADFDLSAEKQHPMAPMLEESLEFDRGPVLDGFNYLTEQHPRFLHLSFLDSDRYGHQANYARYAQVLATYDRLLEKLVNVLDASGEYGKKTALIITTDHGRGQWDQWSEHGPHVPASARVWAFVMLPPAANDFSLEEPNARGFEHHDVRYTIESLFGLSVKRSAHHGSGFLRPPP